MKIRVYRCAACAHDWLGRLKRRPKICPKCKRAAVEIEKEYGGTK